MAMLLAGGQGSRLLTLSRRRAKPAVPFGGIYRIIDFTLSCIMRSNIPVVGILTQYRPYSLMDHVSNGEAWGFYGRKRLAKILQPYLGEEDSDWYAGTADAVFQNLDFIARFPEADVILVLSGDHIYHMDYRSIVEALLDTGADLTVACQEVPWEQTNHFGIMVMGENDRIVDFKEKPKGPVPSNLASLGIYAFRREALIHALREDAKRSGSAHDFGADIIPGMIAAGRTYAYRFNGYWRDVGTVDSYWRAHMDILALDSDLNLEKWKVRTNPHCFGRHNMFPARVDTPGRIIDSLIGLGCVIAGEVRRSVISPGVRVGPGAVIENCVILHDCLIGEGARVRDTIVDKQCAIGAGSVIGEGQDVPNHDVPNNLYSGITLIGKGTQIWPETLIGRNCLIGAGVEPCDMPANGIVPSGTSVGLDHV